VSSLFAFKLCVASKFGFRTISFRISHKLIIASLQIRAVKVGKSRGAVVFRCEWSLVDGVILDFTGSFHGACAVGLGEGVADMLRVKRTKASWLFEWANSN